jgi:hypothetical protein
MRRHASLLVLVGLTALLTGIATADGRATAPTVALTSVSAQSFTADVRWEVDRPSRVVLAIGLDDREAAVWTKQVTVPRAGVYTTRVAPLEPLGGYRVEVHAAVGAARSTASGAFRTGAMPTRAKARATPLGLKVNTRPFFPRMLFRQCPSAHPASIAAGINLFMGTACGTPQRTMASLAGKALLLPDVASRSDGPGVIGWHQLDEADVLVSKPDDLPLLPPSSRTGRTTFLTLSNHVWSGAAQLPGARDLYPGLISRAEVVGLDLYPLQSFCRKDLLAAVYAAQRELVVLARGKPTFQWIEVDPMGVCAGLDPSPALVRAETWLAIAGGARAIGYFPENWRPAIRAEITRLNAEIRALAPALLGPETPVTVVAPSRVLAGGRTLNGATYVIAVNPTFARVGATLVAPALGAGTRRLRVLGESRVVVARDGRFSDRFRGLQARVYVAPPAGFE